MSWTFTKTFYLHVTAPSCVWFSFPPKSFDPMHHREKNYNNKFLLKSKFFCFLAS